MSTKTPHTFDPYSTWLNVEEDCRPLTAYQLLGLTTLENDVQAIRTAAGLRRTAIEAHRDEAAPTLWHQVARELDQAIEILLDPDKKAAYDAALRTQGERNAASDGTSVAIAAEEDGGMVPCQQCNQPNPTGAKFCAQCGTPFRESCFECGSEISAADRYCGACGANLVDGVKQRSDEFEAVLAKAEQSGKDGQYDQAIALLDGVAKAKHPRFTRYAERANQLIRQYGLERDTWRAKLAETEQKARQQTADCQYQAAVDLLETIPAHLRSEPIGQLLEEAKTRLAEIASLEEELGSAVASPRALDLLPKVSRLLTLQPDHVQGRQLAERLRGLVCQAAQEKLTRHEYQEARDLLDRLPEAAPSADVETLRGRAAELAWLSDDLRNAPVVDATLVQVAQRLQALAPGDKRMAKLVAEVGRRKEMAGVDPRRAHLPWAAPSAKTQLGVPVDWLTGFQRIGLKDDLAAPILVEHPGCLFVACGLALQGLELAPLALNLLPDDSRRPIDRIAKVFGQDPRSWVRAKRPCSAWGLDLSASGLKAARLGWGKQDDVIIEDFDVVAHRKTLSEALSAEEARDLVTQTLDVFRSRHIVKADRICLGFSTRMLLTRHFTIPSLDPERREKVVAYEARGHIPVLLQQVAWDYQVVGQREEPKREDKILLVATRRPALDDRLLALRNAGLRVDVVQSDCLALHNFLVYDHFGEKRSDGPATGDGGRGIALLDIGSDQTHLVVSSPTSVWFRSSGLGGEQFTRALVRDVKLTAAQAESLKRNPARAESLHQIYHALEPVLESLLADVRSMLGAFAASDQAQPIERVLGCGGSFRLHGLWRYLRSGF